MKAVLRKMLREIETKNFEEEVLKAGELTAVAFSSPWCPNCQRLGSVLEELAEEYGERPAIVKFDVGKDKAIPAQYQILSIPVLVFFREGKEIDRITGFLPKEKIKEKVEALL